MQQAKSSFLKRHCLISSKGCCNYRQWTTNFLSISNRRMGHLLFTAKCTGAQQPTTPAIMQPTLAESFNHCVSYEKKGSRGQLLWKPVEKPTLHPHAKNFQPQVCATKPQRGMSQAKGSRQALLPGQKCVKKTAVTHLVSCTSINMSCLLCSAMQMFNLFTHLQGYTVLFDDSFVHTLSIPMGKLICFYNNMQSDMLNVCLDVN